MNQRELFEIWAPPQGAWSPWAKPVLFAQIGMLRTPPKPAPPAADVSWAPPASAGTGIIVSLPGAESVHTGLALAEIGYRPVPLYNTSPGANELVPSGGIMSALRDAAPRLQTITLPGDTWDGTGPVAPPAFLIDSDRLVPTRQRLGSFDNRWIVFPQDFPSAALLRSRGIQRMFLAQSPSRARATDLDHVLLRWQRGGLELLEQAPGSGRPAAPLRIRPRLGWRFLPAMALVFVGLKRNSAGGFGGWIPEHTQSSGGWS